MRPSSPYNEWFLPDEVLALAPEPITVEPGASLVPGVTPGFPADLPRVKVDSDGGGVVDGGWVFDHWFVPPATPDPSTLTVVQGYWRFVPLSQAWYEFRSATSGKSLPDAVRALEPEAVGGLFLDEALALRPADVEDVAFDEDGDGSADGTWVFGGWSLENEAPGEGRSAHWVGAWTWEPAGTPPAGETRVAKPSAATSLVYSGELQHGVPSGEGYELFGVTSAEGAGDYSVKATLLPGYAWEDGTSDPVVLNWSIAKATLTAAYTGQAVLATDSEPVLDVTVTGFVGGEGPSTALGYDAPTASLPGAWPLAAGDYLIAPAGGSARNYAFSYLAGTLKVEEPAPPAKPLPGKGALASTGDGLGGATAVAGTAAAAAASALLVARRKGRDAGGGGKSAYGKRPLEAFPAVLGKACCDRKKREKVLRRCP